MSQVPEMQNRLKSAAKNVPVPPYLESRIRSHIRSEERQPRAWYTRFMAPAAVAAAVVVGLGIAYQLGHLRLTASSQQSYIVSVTNRIATLMRVGLGDHIHCAVFRKYPKEAPKTEELLGEIGPEYRELVPLVKDQLPDSYRMTLAHKCRYGGRQFVHLSMMNSTNMVSLVITRKREGESFQTEGMLPALVQSGIPMYQTSVQRFAMTSFESSDFLVYFISDLPQSRNSELMIAMAPAVKQILEKL